MNTEILNEYEEILSQKINSEVATNVVEAIARLHTTVYQEIYVHFGLIKNIEMFVVCYDELCTGGHRTIGKLVVVFVILN